MSYETQLGEYWGQTAQRLHREIARRGYAGGYSMPRDDVHALRPARGSKAMPFNSNLCSEGKPRSILLGSASVSQRSLTSSLLPLADLIDAHAKVERRGMLRGLLYFYTRPVGSN